jgi:hypothetical protein
MHYCERLATRGHRTGTAVVLIMSVLAPYTFPFGVFAGPKRRKHSHRWEWHMNDKEERA